MANPFIHVELGSDAPEATKHFYGKLFDWKFEDSPSAKPGVNYTHIHVGEGTASGLMKKQSPPNVPTAWLPYVLVDDVDVTLKQARALGAYVIVEKMLVPGRGSLAIFVDPQGATLGIWECLKK